MHEFIIVLTSFDTQSSLTKASEDNSTITAAIIAVAGVIIGAILTLLAQLLLNSIENKRDKKKQLYEKQMEIYPLALEYIIFYAQLQIKIRERVNANTITNIKLFLLLVLLKQHKGLMTCENELNLNEFLPRMHIGSWKIYCN